MSEKTVFALFECLLALERLSAKGVNKALMVDLMLGIAPSMRKGDEPTGGYDLH
jgi:hypothetical protein